MFMQLYKMGYVVIPLVGKAPAPGVSGWDEWALDGMPEEEAERFEKNYPLSRYGIGLVAGPESNNTVFIDADTVDKEISSLVPPSPLERVGMRGFARIYSNPNDIRGFNRFRENKNLAIDPSQKPREGIECRSAGSYIAIPPTIHPDTKKPYFWVKEQIQNFDPSYLPPLLVSDVEKIALFNWGSINASGSSMIGSGRNNTLTSVCCGKLVDHAYKTDKEIAEELLQYDEEKHQPKPYFSDPNEHYFNRAKNPMDRAIIFVAGSRRRLIKKKIITADSYIKVDKIEIKKPKQDFYIPKTDSLIADIAEAINSTAYKKQPVLSVGAAISLCGALASLKFAKGINPVSTNLYTMAIARSGAGKDAPQKMIKQILFSEQLGEQRLFGMSNYSSIASFVENLVTQRSRIDVIDEFEETIYGITKGSSLQLAVKSLITELYSVGGGVYGGYKTKTSGVRGKCRAPAVSIYGNIQEDVLIECANKSMIASGFLSRFIFFTGNPLPEYNEDRTDDFKRMKSLCEDLSRAYPSGGIINFDGSSPGADESWSCLPAMRQIVESDAFKQARREMEIELHEQCNKLYMDGKDAESTLLSRIGQNAEKIAVIHATASDRLTIERMDYDYGYAIAKGCYDVSRSVLIAASSDPGFEKEKNWALKYLAKRGGTVIHKKMADSYKKGPDDLRKLMRQLESIGLIEIQEANSGYAYKLR